MENLTKAQIGILIEARKRGAVYPRKRTGMGGNVRRMVERMAAAGLFKPEPPFKITKAGRDAVKHLDDWGGRKSRITPQALKAMAAGSLDGHSGLFSLKTGLPVR